jgi:hypothetical protein
VLPGFEGAGGQPPANGGRQDRQSRAAPPRQRPPSLGGNAHASATASARSAAVNTGGRPLRRASFSPASRPAANRRRHLRTVSVHTPNSTAIAALVLPAAAASTILARSRSRYAPRADRAWAINTASSSPDRTIWHELGTGMLCFVPHPRAGPVTRHAVITQGRTPDEHGQTAQSSTRHAAVVAPVRAREDAGRR